ncbi:exocyst complex component 7-like [Corticium candelabrum]|uniref:exocyst complex component 7-like n=1 Tax=Corticium candelabrum TaxID=121492 RepID=UPI002E30E592|nr:exocyst complex component 7-like [Corticium candelabrum]
MHLIAHLAKQAVTLHETSKTTLFRQSDVMMLKRLKYCIIMDLLNFAACASLYNHSNHGMRTRTVFPALLQCTESRSLSGKWLSYPGDMYVFELPPLYPEYTGLHSDKMDEVTVRRRDIEMRLERDQLAVSSLKESLDRTKQLTDNMVGILDSFENRLQKLDDTIRPVHKETVHLTRLQENVGKAMKSLDHVIELFHVASSVEAQIREGPSGDVDGYLKQMARVTSALEFFSENNPHSVELATLTSLSELGRDMLSKEFRNLLNRHSKPVPVATLMDMLMTPDEDLPPLEHLPGNVMQDLSSIARWLAGPGHSTDFMNIYAQIRSSQVSRSLQGLKEAYKPVTSSAGSKHKQLTGGMKDTPQKRPGVRRSTQRRSSRVFMEVPGGMHSTGVSPDPADFMADESLEGTSLFMHHSSLFLKLMQSEKTLMQSIIAPVHHDRIFESLVQIPMDFLIAAGEDLHNQLKKLLALHEHNVLLAGLRLLRHLTGIQPDYANALRGLKGGPSGRIALLASMLEATCLRGLQSYVEHVKSDPDKKTNLPRDGTVHELTSNTVTHIEHMLEYTDTAGQLLVEQEGAHVVRELGAKKAMGTFLYKVLGVLGLNLELKSKGYEVPALSCVFMLNNYHYIHKSLTRNDTFLSTLEEESPDVEDHYLALIAEQRRGYQKCWSKVLHHILEVNKPQSGAQTDKIKSGEKLSSRQRQAIKDKFRGFNTDFEELHLIQKHYAIPDERLRDSIRQDNVDFLVPHYTTFYDRYASAPFTKNPDKYLKYTPEDVERTLKVSFFDTAA